MLKFYPKCQSLSLTLLIKACFFLTRQLIKRVSYKTIPLSGRGVTQMNPGVLLWLCASRKLPAMCLLSMLYSTIQKCRIPFMCLHKSASPWVSCQNAVVGPRRRNRISNPLQIKEQGSCRFPNWELSPLKCLHLCNLQKLGGRGHKKNKTIPLPQWFLHTFMLVMFNCH